MSVPRALSRGEECFALHCRVHGLTPEREYLFHPTRRWRFDFYFPSHRLAVEVEGGNNGRHQRRAGFEGDAFKYNAATMMGIRVLRYTPAMVESGQAINDVLAILQEVQCPTFR
jgi:very-short-patch-repair endonuclease